MIQKDFQKNQEENNNQNTIIINQDLEYGLLEQRDSILSRQSI